MDQAAQTHARTSEPAAPADDAADPGCETVRFTVGNARPVDSRTLFALVDVEMRIADVAFEILGVQARRTPAGTAIELPAVRDPGGTWRPAIRLPPELRAPLAEAVTAYLLETGLARPRFAGPRLRSRPAQGRPFEPQRADGAGSGAHDVWSAWPRKADAPGEALIRSSLSTRAMRNGAEFTVGGSPVASPMRRSVPWPHGCCRWRRNARMQYSCVC